jgi:hypothetical protein
MSLGLLTKLLDSSSSEAVYRAPLGLLMGGGLI